jgi:hypothetical protein
VIIARCGLKENDLRKEEPHARVRWGERTWGPDGVCAPMGYTSKYSRSVSTTSGGRQSSGRAPSTVATRQGDFMPEALLTAAMSPAACGVLTVRRTRMSAGSMSFP